MTDIKKMTVGQVVDFCIDYNNRHKREEQDSKNNKPKRRRATQEEIDAFLG